MSAIKGMKAVNKYQNSCDHQLVIKFISTKIAIILTRNNATFFKDRNHLSDKDSILLE